MLLELLKVKVLLVSLKDMVLNIYKKNPIEVIEKLDVLEDGIQPELDIQLPEQVNLVIIIERKLIKKYIKSEMDQIKKLL